jgi:Leucine-rich repeat (LRR) protein
MEGKVTVVCGKVEDLPTVPCDSTFSWSKRGSPRRPPRQCHRLAQRRYVATFGPSKQIGQQAEAEARLVSQDRTRPVVVLADGAAWIKTEQAKHFPQATCILDGAHLWREVRRALRAAARAKALSALGLTTLLPEVGQLSELQGLDLSDNQLTSVPGELGQLTQLQNLDLAKNPNLHHPPPDVVHNGVEAILTSLRTRRSERTLWS